MTPLRVFFPCRWLSEDPLGFAAGDSNLQRYVGNNPLTFIDPSGLEECTCGDVGAYFSARSAAAAPTGSPLLTLLDSLALLGLELAHSAWVLRLGAFIGGALGGLVLAHQWQLLRAEGDTGAGADEVPDVIPADVLQLKQEIEELKKDLDKGFDVMDNEQEQAWLDTFYKLQRLLKRYKDWQDGGDPWPEL